MERVAESLAAVAGLGATSNHDLTGRMFQTLIANRRFLATFYPLPESAGLLAELAGGRLRQNWSDRTLIEYLRMPDFACGTGPCSRRRSGRRAGATGASAAARTCTGHGWSAS